MTHPLYIIIGLGSSNNHSSVFPNTMAKIVEAESGPACIDDRSHPSRDATDEEIGSLRHVVDKLPEKSGSRYW